ncbi:MAG: hypothetical protein APF76_12630 [Desulfitibacter sp. BRH_c19]|nr:MAG: hypothetical protein APF76_12630 [Desulfitibacter sp. BRH_c19]
MLLDFFLVEGSVLGIISMILFYIFTSIIGEGRLYFPVRPGRLHILAGEDPAEVWTSQPPRIESWRHYGNVLF